jgi:transcriptional regulatory protein LevR
VKVGNFLYESVKNIENILDAIKDKNVEKNFVFYISCLITRLKSKTVIQRQLISLLKNVAHSSICSPATNRNVFVYSFSS